MRQTIELWDTKKSVNEYGVEQETKELFLSCAAAVKHVGNEVVGDTTKGFNVTVEFTVRYNRYFKAPNNSMYIMWDGQEWDIINHNNWWSQNKYITLTAVKRSK
ncbi:head-tail adaptor protein [Photobacterium swingsii]